MFHSFYVSTKGHGSCAHAVHIKRNWASRLSLFSLWRKLGEVEKVLVHSRTRVECPVWVGGSLLPAVDCRYLWVLFTSEGKVEWESDMWMEVVSTVMPSLYQSVVVRMCSGWSTYWSFILNWHFLRIFSVKGMRRSKPASATNKPVYCDLWTRRWLCDVVTLNICFSSVTDVGCDDNVWLHTKWSLAGVKSHLGQTG